MLSSVYLEVKIKEAKCGQYIIWITITEIERQFTP